MSDRSCPNCGHAVAAAAADCPCGYSFEENEIAVPGPGIVRSSLEQAGAAQPALAAVEEGPRKGGPPEGRPRADRPARRPAASAPRAGEAMLMSCPSCGAKISRRAPMCPKCGHAPYDHCMVCSARILVNSAPCPECGDPTPFDLPPA